MSLRAAVRRSQLRIYDAEKKKKRGRKRRKEKEKKERKKKRKERKRGKKKRKERKKKGKKKLAYFALEWPRTFIQFLFEIELTSRNILALLWIIYLVLRSLLVHC